MNISNTLASVKIDGVYYELKKGTTTIEKIKIDVNI